METEFSHTLLHYLLLMKFILVPHYNFHFYLQYLMQGSKSFSVRVLVPS